LIRFGNVSNKGEEVSENWLFFENPAF